MASASPSTAPFTSPAPGTPDPWGSPTGNLALADIHQALVEDDRESFEIAAGKLLAQPNWTLDAIVRLQEQGVRNTRAGPSCTVPIQPPPPPACTVTIDKASLAVLGPFALLPVVVRALARWIELDDAAGFTRVLLVKEQQFDACRVRGLDAEVHPCGCDEVTEAGAAASVNLQRSHGLLCGLDSHLPSLPQPCSTSIQRRIPGIGDHPRAYPSRLDGTDLTYSF